MFICMAGNINGSGGKISENYIFTQIKLARITFSQALRIKILL